MFYEESESEEKTFRQLQLMSDSVRAYLIGDKELSTLIAKLDALFHTSDSISDYFSKNFQKLWGRLEDTLALMLDENRVELNDFDRKLVTDSLHQLLAVIERENRGLEQDGLCGSRATTSRACRMQVQREDKETFPP